MLHATHCDRSIGPLILLIFFVVLIFGFIYVYLFIPETKGLELEEVILPERLPR